MSEFCLWICMCTTHLSPKLVSYLSPPSHPVTSFVQSNSSVTQVTNGLFTLRLLSGMAFHQAIGSWSGRILGNEWITGLKPLMTSLHLSLYSKLLRPALFSPFSSFRSSTCPIPLPIAPQIPTHCHWSVVYIWCLISILLCRKDNGPPCCVHSPLSCTASYFNRQLWPDVSPAYLYLVSLFLSSWHYAGL